MPLRTIEGDHRRKSVVRKGLIAATATLAVGSVSGAVGYKAGESQRGQQDAAKIGHKNAAPQTPRPKTDEPALTHEQVKQSRLALTPVAIKAALSILKDMKVDSADLQSYPGDQEITNNQDNQGDNPFPNFDATFTKQNYLCQKMNMIHITAGSSSSDPETLATHSSDLELIFYVTDQNPLAKKIKPCPANPNTPIPLQTLSLKDFVQGLTAKGTVQLVEIGGDTGIDANNKRAVENAPGLLFQEGNAYATSTAFGNCYLFGRDTCDAQDYPPKQSSVELHSISTLSTTASKVSSVLLTAMANLSNETQSAESTLMSSSVVPG